jgi:hypothetical protein
LHLDVLEDRCLPSLFGAFAPYPVGQSPNSVAMRDFNGDGIPDLAVANTSGSVSILLGNGNGTFGAAGAPIQLGHDPTSIAFGDFNRDGKLDLVTGNNDGTVSVLLGNGDGTFQNPVTYTDGLGSSDAYVAVADFARNGIPDLAVAEGSGQVNILLGQGDGSFSLLQIFPTPGNITSIAVGDFNGDGLPDIAVTDTTNNTVDLLEGAGGGYFNCCGVVTVGTDPTSLAVGDFNGDGKLDLAVANSGSINISVLLGNGDGTFGNATNYTMNGRPDSVAMGDFNGDGELDLAVANLGNNVSVLLGNGGGGFGNPTNYQLAPYPVAVVAGDFNRDGAQDLAVVCDPENGSSGSVDVLLNQTPVTTTVVTSNPNPAVVGQLVTFTAKVTQAVPRSVAPTGVVYFWDSTTFLGTGTVSASGTATFSTSLLGPGEHYIMASYQGDPNFTGSSSPFINLVVNQDATTTGLSVSASPGIAGQPITLTATVAGAAPGTGAPSGMVRFVDGPATIGSGALNGAGIATLITSALASGSHSLSAVYVGDSNFISSIVSAVTEIINNPAPILTSISPSTLPEGSPGFTLTLTGSNFVPGATVQWNTTPLTVTAANSTQIQATVPASLLTQEGTPLLTVTNPSPGGGASLTQTFTITDAALAASRVNLNVHGNLNFSGTVANFTDSNLGATAADFSAVIVWDDNSASVGTVGGTGPFTVSGTHTFLAFKNLHTISVTIFDQGGSTATVTDDVTDPTANQAYVMRLYQDLLQRPADPAGLAHWSGLLDRGVSRAQVALSIEQSLEYRKDEVQALYAHYLHRNADPAGLAVFTNFLAHGGTLEQVAADLVGSGEYYQTRAGGTNAGFLDALYHDALGRNIDSAGQSLFSNRLADGVTRRDIASAIFGSGECRQDLVQGYYHSILGRAAGHAGLAYFADALAGGTRDETVMADILASEEFFTKL